MTNHDHRRSAALPSLRRQPCYDLDTAWQLLALTSELPATRRGLHAVLIEYRHALHALASQLQATRHGQQPPQPAHRRETPRPAADAGATRPLAGA